LKKSMSTDKTVKKIDATINLFVSTAYHF